MYANKDVVVDFEENKKTTHVGQHSPSNKSEEDSELLMRDTNGFQSKIINEVPQEQE